MFPDNFTEKIKKERNLYRERIISNVVSQITNTIDTTKENLKSGETRELTFSFTEFKNDIEIARELMKIFEYKNCFIKLSLDDDKLLQIYYPSQLICPEELIIKFKIVGGENTENDESLLICQHC